MGYSIENVTIWVNGQSKQGNWIDAKIVNDNLSDWAQFYWQISYVTIVDDVEQTAPITQGNTSISGAAYEAWGQAADINFAAYEYICSQLNLTLIP